MADLLRSPLHDAHVTAGGRLVDFAGWQLPVRYGSILEEAKSVRNAKGMFDVSHMGRFVLRGPGAFETLQNLGTNDLARITPGRCQYTLWLDDNAEVIDDLIVNWLDHDEFLIVVNASNREKDFAHLEDNLRGAAAVDQTFETAMIAVQGPGAIDAVDKLGADSATLPRFAVAPRMVANAGCAVARTGYTGEDGVELVCDADEAPQVWNALAALGVTPCGLGARDALRTEMGLPLYGHEIGNGATPTEARLSFALRTSDRDFIGKQALAAKKTTRRLVGFVAEQQCIPMPGDKLGDAGLVTSGATSVVLQKPVGLAYIPIDAPTGPSVLFNRNKSIPVEVKELPLIDRARPKK